MKANLRGSPIKKDQRILNLKSEGMGETALLKGLIRFLNTGPLSIAALPRGNNSVDLVIEPRDSL